MLSTLSGNVGPVLMSLTGDNDDGRALGKVNWKKVRAKFKKVAKVAAYAVPGVAVYKAAKATSEALKRKRAANIQKLNIERANRARKLAEARRSQLKAEAEARALDEQGKTAAAEVARARAATAAESVEAQNEPEVEPETETPADESEEIQDTTEEGAEESVESMGYARSNDDYFIGAPGPAPTPVTSSQIKVAPAGTPKKTLYILGGLALAAFLFRKQLKRAFK